LQTAVGDRPVAFRLRTFPVEPRLAVGYLELAEDVGDMVLDGLEAEDEFPGYVGVGPPGKQSCPTLLADLLD